MHGKITTNSQLLTTEPKTKNPKQTKQTTRQNHRNGEHMEGYQWGVGRERGGKCTENKWHKW